MSTEEAVQQELFDAAKSPEPQEPSAPEPAQESSAGPEPEAASPESTPEPTRAEQHAAPEESIPSWRLREEAEARRQAEDRARTLEQRYNEALAHWQQQNKKAQPAPDFFQDPQAAVQAAIQQQLAPMQAQYHRAIQQLARGQAESVHGAEAVALAEKVFMQARDQRMLDPMDYERVVQAPNRFDACVEWYRRLYALHTVGNDPEAWYTKRRDAELADPKFQAQYLERIRGAAATRPAMTELPPTLSRSTAAAGNGAGTGGDMSNESLWANARR